jgi:hypothetical protein
MSPADNDGRRIHLDDFSTRKRSAVTFLGHVSPRVRSSGNGVGLRMIGNKYESTVILHGRRALHEDLSKMLLCTFYG